jgi:hypothetical protein
VSRADRIHRNATNAMRLAEEAIAQIKAGEFKRGGETLHKAGQKAHLAEADCREHTERKEIIRGEGVK